MSKEGNAHSAVFNAVKRGDLPKVSTLNCTYCNRAAAAYHHHMGYNKKNYLNVVPVCNSCHALKHGGRNGELKLTDGDVIAAREMRRGGLSVKSIADHFKHDYGSMSEILLRKSYKWVK